MGVEGCSVASLVHGRNNLSGVRRPGPYLSPGAAICRVVPKCLADGNHAALHNLARSTGAGLANLIQCNDMTRPPHRGAVRGSLPAFAREPDLRRTFARKGAVAHDFVLIAAGALLVMLGTWRAYLHWVSTRRMLALQRYESLFVDNTEAVIVLDEDCAVASVNAAFTRLTGWTADALTATPFTDYVLSEDRARVSSTVDAALRGSPQTCEVVLEDRKGRPIEVRLTSVPITRGSRVVGAHQIVHDIRLHKEMERRLATQALHDYLTGLPNRALFQDRLEHAFERSRRSGTPVALFYIDLDRFKVINDGEGHEAGDALLRTVANRLGCFLRGRDTVARLGGDEFAILMEEVEGEGAAAAAAERIVKLFYEPFYWKGREFLFGGSVGGAVSGPEIDSPDELVRRADMAMYAAKQVGGRRYQMYRPDLESRDESVLWRLESDLCRAIENGELVVHYQPIVDLAGTRIVGVEALARWRHPVFGLLGPDRFIPLAEKTGLIIPLDHWVLAQACRDVTKLTRAGLASSTPLFLSVNYSRLHLESEDSLEVIANILAAERFDPRRIQLEITESVAGSDRKKLNSLKSLGVMLAIDDFGTGYSSLGYLKDVEVDVLKIDRSFVRTLGDEQSAVAIVRTILTLAEMLDLGVIIEGIEDATQLRLLQELGGRFVQGFYFAEPMDLPALERIVRVGLPPEWILRLGSTRPGHGGGHTASGVVA